MRTVARSMAPPVGTVKRGNAGGRLKRLISTSHNARYIDSHRWSNDFRRSGPLSPGVMQAFPRQSDGKRRVPPEGWHRAVVTAPDSLP